MPATPRVDKLIKLATKAQPFCQGTIRFSLGRIYAKAPDAIRLHRLDAVLPLARNDNASQDNGDGEDDHGKHYPSQAHFRALHKVEIAEAVRELASYFRDVYKVVPRDAKNEAVGCVNAVIVGAYHLCE